MSGEAPGGLPIIIVQSFEPSLLSIMRETLELEGYSCRATHTAGETLALVNGDEGTYIVLMDNMHVSQEAQLFARLVFALPDLHRRVKVVGLMARFHQERFKLDCFIALPFRVAQLLDPIERLCAELEAVR